MLGRVPLVLLVDDEPVIVRLLEINFRAAGYEVATASSGAAAIAALDGGTPDVVVLDLGLPDIDGWEVVEQLRAREQSATTPVVVLSGADRDAAGERGYAADVQAFLTKPVDPADLVETVRRVTRRDA
jgi:DNA-binding response OmpR family regulator